MPIEGSKTTKDLEGHQITGLGGLTGIAVPGTNELLNVVVLQDPSTGAGLVADIGSTAVIVSDGHVIAHFYKFGAGNHDWNQGAGPVGQAAGLTLWFNNPQSAFSLPTTGPLTTISFVASPPSIVRSSGSWSDDGWVAREKCVVSGSVNDGYWSICGVTDTTLTLNSTAVITPAFAGPPITLVADYQEMDVAPSSGTQQDEYVSVTSADTGGVPIDSYLTDVLVPGALSIPIGNWTFADYFYVNSGNTCSVAFQVSKVSESGASTALFTTLKSAPITATSALTPQLVNAIYTVTVAIPLLTTDRIAITPLFFNTSPSPISCHQIYQGSLFAGFVTSTFGVIGVVGPAGPAGPPGYSTGANFYYDSTDSGITVPTTGVKTDISFVASTPPVINRVSGSFVTDGFVFAHRVIITGAGHLANNGEHRIASVTTNQIVLTYEDIIVGENAGSPVNIIVQDSTLLPYPSVLPTMDKSVSVSSSDIDGVELCTFVTQLGSPNQLSIPVGIWTFDGWFYADTPGVCSIYYEVAKKYDDTIPSTFLFATSNTSPIMATSALLPQELSVPYTVGSIIGLLAGDRIIIRVIARCTSPTPATVHHLYGDSLYPGFVNTTLPGIYNSKPSFVSIGLGTTPDATAVMVAAGQYLSKEYIATHDIDWNNGNVQFLQLVSGSNSVTFTGGEAGGRYLLITKQPASGGNGTVSWPGDILWPGNVNPPLTTTNGKKDPLAFVYEGVDRQYLGSYILNY